MGSSACQVKYFQHTDNLKACSMVFEISCMPLPLCLQGLATGRCSFSSYSTNK